MTKGNQIALESPEGSPSGPITRGELENLQDLLNAIKAVEPERSRKLAMIGSTVAHLCRCLGRSPESIGVRNLGDKVFEFKDYLKARRLARNSIRTYLYNFHLLVRKAQALGCKGQVDEVAEEWQSILDTLKVRGCSGVVRYAIRRGLNPAQFSNVDLDGIVQSMIASGRAYSTATHLRREFLKCISQLGLSTRFPRLSPWNPKISYGIPLPQIPSMLRGEISSLLEWKTNPYQDDRPKGCRHRPITATGLQKFLCQAYGYSCKIQGREVNTLAELLSKEVFGDYLDWAIAYRGVKLSSLIARFVTVKSIVSTYPPLANKKIQKRLEWVARRLSQLQEQREEDGESPAERKSLRSIEYEVLTNIPSQIDSEIKALGGQPRGGKAILCRDKLLISWFSTLPWRQRNVRELTLRDQKQTTRLFKSKIPPYLAVPRTDWVKDALKQNPHAEFWQVIAYPRGNKTRRKIHMMLPKQLIPPLEEYLAHGRPMLIRNQDRGTLFVNDWGEPYSLGGICNHVEEVTLRYAGKRVNPHLIRDIVAFGWLKKHPGDFLTVQKLLWHERLETTIRVYGHDFNEAYAACRMEEYLDEHEGNTNSALTQAPKTESYQGMRCASFGTGGRVIR